MGRLSTSHQEEAFLPFSHFPSLLLKLQHWASLGLMIHLSWHILLPGKRGDISLSFGWLPVQIVCKSIPTPTVAYHQQKAPAPPECLCSSCCGKWGLWCHLVSAPGQGILPRCWLMRGFYSLPPLYRPCFGFLHQWGERRSSSESVCSHKHSDSTVSTVARRRLMSRRRWSPDPHLKNCAHVTAAGTRTERVFISKDHESTVQDLCHYSKDTVNVHIMKSRQFCFWFVCMGCFFYHVHRGGAGCDLSLCRQKHLPAVSVCVLWPNHCTEIENVKHDLQSFRGC